jgi:hypothetical protein
MMMKTRQKSLLLPILMTALLLASCAPAAGGTPSGSTRAWVDQPVTNALLPLASFTIRAHASRPSGGIVKMVFLVNSIEVGNAGTDSSTAIVTAETDWTPSAPGEYTIQAQAFSADGVSLSEAARVCVSASVNQAQPGFLGDCGSSALDVTPSPTKEQPGILTPATFTPSLTLSPSLATVVLPSPTFTLSPVPVILPSATFTPTPGAIAGMVFFDNNANGVFDAGDEGKNTYELNLFRNSTCTGSVYMVAFPDSAGNFVLSDLAAGTWCLNLLYTGSSVLPSNPQAVSVPSGSTIYLDFAIQPPG